MKKRSKKSNPTFYKIVSTLLLTVTVVFVIILSYSDLLPIKYFKLIITILLIFDILNIFLINLKRLKKKVKRFLCLFIFLSMIIMGVGSTYLYKTTDVLKGNGDTKYKVENYSLIVLSNSSISKLEDINTIGYYENSNGSDEAKKKLNSIKKYEFESYKTSDILVSELLNKNIDSMMIEDSILNLIYEENEEFKNSTKIIHTFKIKVKVKSTLKEANVTKESFAVYISGIDTYGEISSVSRSDVNIVAIINPKTKQLLLISIPRDYYVKLHGTSGPKDKLTHAGIYGIDMSIHTIEDLLNIDINYYVKVNFTSVIDMVDAIGGLEVYSEYTFISYSGYSFRKGMNKVNGEQALDFARTRKAFANGDRQRGINQQALIEAALRKVTNKSIITKYTSLLNSINGKYQTNMEYKKITSLIKMQLNDMAKWTVTSYSLTGTDSSNYTYTYNQLLYVMEPDTNSIEEAKLLIKSILGNEELEGSYDNIGGSTNNVYKINTNSTNSSATSNKSNEKKVEEKKNEEKKEELVEKKEELETDNNNNNNNTSDEEILLPITPTDEDDEYINTNEFDENNNVEEKITDN